MVQCPHFQNDYTAWIKDHAEQLQQETDSEAKQIHRDMIRNCKAWQKSEALNHKAWCLGQNDALQRLCKIAQLDNKTL